MTFDEYGSPSRAARSSGNLTTHLTSSCLPTVNPFHQVSKRRCSSHLETDLCRQGKVGEVVLYIHDPVSEEKIYRATDTYRAGSCNGETETTVLCTGDRGFVY